MLVLKRIQQCLDPHSSVRIHNTGNLEDTQDYLHATVGTNQQLISLGYQKS